MPIVFGLLVAAVILVPIHSWWENRRFDTPLEGLVKGDCVDDGEGGFDVRDCGGAEYTVIAVLASPVPDVPDDYGPLGYYRNNVAPALESACAAALYEGSGAPVDRAT